MNSPIYFPSPQIQNWLHELSQHSDARLASQAQVFLQQTQANVQQQLEKYRLLHSFGLSNDQLVKFAEYEGCSEHAIQTLLIQVLAVDAEAAAAIVRQA